jgi:hypothetical protein
VEHENVNGTQACKQAEQTEIESCLDSSRGIGCSARLDLGDYDIAQGRYQSRPSIKNPAWSRSDRDRAEQASGSVRLVLLGDLQDKP